jgi:hypothetical protein
MQFNSRDYYVAAARGQIVPHRSNPLLMKDAREEVAELTAKDKKLRIRMSKLFESFPGDIILYSLHSVPDIWLVLITFI